MKIIKSENVVFFDVDETLVTAEQFISCTGVHVADPVEPGRVIVRYQHLGNIRLLREEYQRGSTIIVWSRGGWEWATNVIKALLLTNLVHTVMSKPLVYFDDVPVEQWLTQRVYLDPRLKYK